jgi:CheY-like chemotaxis protein
MVEPLTPPADALTAEEWRERVRACFESLRQQGVPLVVETLDGVQTEGRIESLDEAKGRVVLSLPEVPSAGMEADDEVLLFFSMSGSRWLGRARVHYHNDRRNRFTLILPRRLEPGDRRREARVLLDTTENVKATFRASGAEHIQVTGRLSNLSEGGFRLAVESARDEEDGRTLDPGDVPIEEEQFLEAIWITGLREAPVVTQGVVMEVDPQPLGPILGVRFRAILKPEREFLRAFILARAEAAPAAVPEPGALPPPPDVPDEPPPAPEPSAEPGAHPGSVSQRVKRFRTLALVMPPGPERETLKAYLASQGFTRVLPAGTLAELAGLTRRSPADVYLVDWSDPSAPELDIVHFLGHHPFPAPPRIILACANTTTQLAREANRLGVTHLLVKPYALDGALVELLLHQLKGDED